MILVIKVMKILKPHGDQHLGYCTFLCLEALVKLPIVSRKYNIKIAFPHIMQGISRFVFGTYYDCHIVHIYLLC